MAELNCIKPVTILMADDDLDDQLMVKEAFEENLIVNPLQFVSNGEELMNYLYHRGNFNQQNAPIPGLILLDLNMPKKDGRQALREIKQDPYLKRIPIIILTTSKATDDIVNSYDFGVSSYIPKPVSFDGLLEITKQIGKYWFDIVVLPDQVAP